MRVGSYAFLTDAGDLTSGATTVAEVSGAAALLLNSHGYVDRDYNSALGAVEVGDRVTWFPGIGSCWYHDRVTEILIDPPAPSRKLIRIANDTEEACGGTAARQSDPDCLDDFRANVAALGWNNPPSERDIGPDGIRILPYRYPVEGSHTYRLGLGVSASDVVIDVPAGMRLVDAAIALLSSGTDYATYIDEVSGGAVSFNPETGDNVYWFVPSPDGASQPPADVVARCAALVASIRVAPLPWRIAGDTLGSRRWRLRARPFCCSVREPQDRSNPLRLMSATPTTSLGSERSGRKPAAAG